MSDDLTPNQRLTELMTRAARGALKSTPEVAQVIAEAVKREITRPERGTATNSHASSMHADAEHGGAAHALWTEISDLADAPSGPRSLVVCDRFLHVLAAYWLAIDTRSDAAVRLFFEQWDPNDGQVFKALWAQLVEVTATVRDEPKAGLSWRDLTQLGQAWEDAWPNCPPAGHRLVGKDESSWIRFWSLPRGKRYADDEVETEEIISRHLTVLADLCELTQTSREDLRVVTIGWSDSEWPAPRMAGGLGATWDGDLICESPPSAYWKAVPYDLSDPEDPTWAHLYVGRTEVTNPLLRSLLLLVADDQAAGVTICPPALEWVYHPYDGGGDVIVNQREVRVELRRRHPEWLGTESADLDA